jgi:hypothetical protein
MHHRVHASRVTTARRSRISKLATLFVTLGVLAGVAFASPAGAAAAWNTLPSPSPAGSIGTSLSGIACPSTKSCFAVGSYSTATDVKTLAEHWNGSNWGTLPSPNPSPTATLSGIACPSTKSCFAVGNYTAGGVQRTLAEHWNGSAWAIQSSPNPSSSLGTGLTGIACGSLRSCFAVGIFSTGSETRTLVLHWNGTLWGTLPSVNPSSSSVLNNIACPSVRSCFAVGNYTQGSAARPFVEHWNGSVWGTLPSLRPNGSTGASFNNIACPAVRSCFAVGSYSTASTTRNLVEHWNGAAWALQPNVTLAGVTSTALNGIACPTTSSCFAVGNPSANRNSVEHWNGSAWGNLPVPSPGSIVNHLYNVACPSKALCFAVGDYTRTPPAHGLTLRYA